MSVRDEERIHCEKLVELVREAVQKDNELRDKYQMGDKFRFIRDRLSALLHSLERSIEVSTSAGKEKINRQEVENETRVHVYLYNAQGLQFRSWQAMVNPRFFYEYSVNRPIYADKAYIDSLIRSKTNKAQHAYLTFIIHNDDLLPVAEELVSKDMIGNPLVKVKENKLRVEKFVSFTHNEKEYELTDSGELIPKH